MSSKPKGKTEEETAALAEYAAVIALWNIKGACPFCHRVMVRSPQFDEPQFIDHVVRAHT